MSDFKIKVGLKFDDGIKGLVSECLEEMTFQLGLDYKLDKLNLNEDDLLIMRIPTDEDGDIIVDFESVSNYFDSVKDSVDCKVIALPDDYALEVMNDEEFETYVELLNKELKRRKQIGLFN